MQLFRSTLGTVALALSSLSLGAQQTPAADLESRIADAVANIHLAQLPEAERKLRAILASDPHATEVHFVLGYVLLRERRPAESLTEYNAGVQLRTPTSEEMISVASDYILLKDLPDAEKSLLFAATHDPSNAAVWYLLGRTQYNQDHNADAAHSFARSLELRPRDVRAEYNLGLAFEKLDRASDAMGAYNTAITWQSGTSDPDPQPYLDLGSLLLRQGKPAEALGPLQQAVHFGPRNALANQQLGLALEALHRDQEAIASLQRAAALAPGAEQPHFFLGRIFRRLGRTADAAQQYTVVSRLLGSHSDTATPNQDSPPQANPTFH